MLGDCAGLLLNWACQGTCACEPWGREKPKRTAPGEALVSRHRTRVQFPPPPPLSWWPRHAVASEQQEGVPFAGRPPAYAVTRLVRVGTECRQACSVAADPAAA